MVNHRIYKIEDYIPKALQVIREEFKDEDAISKTYNGYIASFAASLVQSGLIPTIAFYSNKNVEKVDQQQRKKDVNAPDRTKVISLISKILEIQNDSLLDYVLRTESNSFDRKQLEEKIKRIVVALKLALRTFKFIDGGDE